MCSFSLHFSVIWAYFWNLEFFNFPFGPTSKGESSEENQRVHDVEKMSMRRLDVATKQASVVQHTGLWLRTGCVTNAQVSVFERTGF